MEYIYKIYQSLNIKVKPLVVNATNNQSQKPAKNPSAKTC